MHKIFPVSASADNLDFTSGRNSQRSLGSKITFIPGAVSPIIRLQFTTSSSRSHLNFTQSKPRSANVLTTSSISSIFRWLDQAPTFTRSLMGPPSKSTTRMSRDLAMASQIAHSNPSYSRQNAKGSFWRVIAFKSFPIRYYDQFQIFLVL